MCDSAFILRLYTNVLLDHKANYKVNDADIRTGIQNMKEVYKPNPNSLSGTIVDVANFNDTAHRIAYLHKYAPFHTALVADMVKRVLQENLKIFKDIICPSRHINVCSLGGGPGSDIFGVLISLNATFGYFRVSATIIDCMENWKSTFDELITELRYGNYGALGECVREQYFDWKYLQHNLLAKMTNQVNTAIGQADLVTMVKFVSASSCKDTPAMIAKIFRTVKPGTLVLFIDNAGGGFHQVLKREAKNYKLETVFGPLMHHQYINHDFNVKRFGYTPCLESKVTVQIWRKTFQNANPRLALNDLSEPQSIMNILPTVCNINQTTITQINNFDPKRQAQISSISCSRTNYGFTSPESVTNRGEFRNIPTTSSHEYMQRIIYAQSTYSNQPSTVTNHNYDTRRTETYPNVSVGQLPQRPAILSQSRKSTPTSPVTHSQPRRSTPTSSATHSQPRRSTPTSSAIHSQPRRSTPTSIQPPRNEVEYRRVGNEGTERNDDCCACCVIS